MARVQGVAVTRLRPLDLDARALRERRRLNTCDLVWLSDGRFVRVITSERLDGEVIAYRGDVIPDPFGIGYPVPDGELAFEPCHIAEHWQPQGFAAFVERWGLNVERSRRTHNRDWPAATRASSWTRAGLAFIEAGGDPFAKNPARGTPE